MVTLTGIDSLGMEIQRTREKRDNLRNQKRQLENQLMPLDFKGKSVEENAGALWERYVCLMNTNLEYKLICERYSEITEKLETLYSEQRRKRDYIN